jgi:hypothetical protein
MGGSRHHGASSRPWGRIPSSPGGHVPSISHLVPSSGLGFSSSVPSSPSTADQRRSFNFPGHIPTYIPSYVYGGPPPLGRYTHGPASVAATSVSAAVPLCSLSRGDISHSSASDVTMSFWTPAPSGGPPLPVRPPPPAASPTAAVPVHPLPVRPPTPAASPTVAVSAPTLASLLLPLLLTSTHPPFVLPRSSNFLRFLRTQKDTWISRNSLTTTSVFLNTLPDAQMMPSSLTLPIPRPANFGRARFVSQSRMGPFISSSRTLGQNFTGKDSKCWLFSTSTVALTQW